MYSRHWVPLVFTKRPHARPSIAQDWTAGNDPKVVAISQGTQASGPARSRKIKQHERYDAPKQMARKSTQQKQITGKETEDPKSKGPGKGARKGSGKAIASRKKRRDSKEAFSESEYTFYDDYESVKDKVGKRPPSKRLAGEDAENLELPSRQTPKKKDTEERTKRKRKKTMNQGQ